MSAGTPLAANTTLISIKTIDTANNRISVGRAQLRRKISVFGQSFDASKGRNPLIAPQL